MTDKQGDWFAALRWVDGIFPKCLECRYYKGEKACKLYALCKGPGGAPSLVFQQRQMEAMKE